MADILAPFQKMGSDEGGESSLKEFHNRLKTALNHHPELKAQESREAEFNLHIAEVRAEWLPQLNIGLEQRTNLSSANRQAFDNGRRIDAVATLSQLLWDFGANGYHLDAAKLSAEAEQWQTRATVENLLQRAITAHYEVLRYQSHLALAKDNLDHHQQILEDVKIRHAGGTGSQAEVLRAKSRTAEANAKRVSLKGQQQQSVNAYFELFFQPPPVQASLLSFLVPASTNAQEQLSEAIKNNALLHRSLLEVNASEASARAEYLEQMPRVSLNLEGRQFDLNRYASDDNDLALLINVDYAPYTGGAASARVAQARERAVQTTYERQALRRELERQVRNSYTEVLTLQAEWQVQLTTLEAALDAREAYNDQFAIGRRNLTDLLDTQREVFQSAMRLVDLHVDWNIARAQQLMTTGQLLGILNIRLDNSGIAHDSAK